LTRATFKPLRVDWLLPARDWHFAHGHAKAVPAATVRFQGRRQAMKKRLA
jgi:hypothetical protein